MGRHSFYGLVRPALHGSGAGRDKRLFLIFPSFLYPGTFVPFQLKEKISINQYRHLTESLFFLKTYSLPKNSRCCVPPDFNIWPMRGFKEKSERK